MNKFKIGIGLGGPSILMIFVVLCLTTLSTLSLVTANGDWALTQKTTEAVTNYYAADGEAEETIAAADASLLAGQNLEATTFHFKVSDNQDLVLRLGTQNNRITVLSQRLVPKSYWNYEDYEVEFNDALVE